MSMFPTCKITVLKTLYHEDLAEAYRRPDVPKGPCPFFSEGQEFIGSISPNGQKGSIVIGLGMTFTKSSWF